MNRQNLARIVGLAALSTVCCLGSFAQAATYYWTTSSGSGGVGAWDVSGAQNWGTDASGNTSSLQNWSGSPNDTAEFYTGSGTVTVNNTQSVGNITFDAGAAYTLSGGSLGLSGGSVNVDGNATISSLIGGSAGLTKTGSGTLILSAANSYQGPTVVSAGVLRLQSAAAVPAGTMIMPIGDSITYGIGGSNAGYRGFLYNDLAAAGGQFQFVGTTNGNPGSLPTTPVNQTYHDGWGGWTTGDVLGTYRGGSNNGVSGNISSWLTQLANSGQSPTVITMLIGTNDPIVGGWSVSQATSNVSAIVDIVHTQDPGAQVLLGQVIPRLDSYNSWVQSYNAALVGLVAQKQAAGDNIALVNLNTGFSAAAGGLYVDGLHPDDTGYTFMAAQWANAILGTGSSAVAGIPAASPVTVAAGATLDLAGNTATICSLSGSGNVFDSGALTVSSASGGSATFAGVIWGAGGLTKLGAGLQALSGSNVYAGGTTVSAGTLQIGNVAALGTGPLAVNGGAFDLGGVNFSIAAFSGAGGAVTNNGAGPATLTVAPASGASTFAGAIADGLSTVGLTVNGAGALVLTGSNTYSGATTVSAGTLQIGNGTSGEYLASPSISVYSGAALVFNHGDALTYAGAISGAGSLAKLGSGLLALSGSNIAYTGGTTISGGTLQLVNCTTFDSQVTDNSTLVLEQDSGPWYSYYNFTIGGSGAVTKTGTGQIFLNANSYTGSTTVASGVVLPGANASLGSGSVTVASGAAISLQVSGVNLANPLTLSGSGYSDPASYGPLTTGALYSVVNAGTWSGPITLAADAGVVAEAAPLTISGPISGSHGLSVLQFYLNNTVILTGSNTYTGPTAVNAGTLQIGNGGSGEYLASPSISVAGGAALAFDHADSLTYSGSITGYGSLTKLGGGALTLTGSNTLYGPTTVSAGTLQIGNGGTGEFLGYSPITVASGATLAYNFSDTLYISGIAGGGAVAKSGSGALVVGADSYSGGTTLNDGYVLPYSNSAFGSGGVTVNNGAGISLQVPGLNIANALTISGSGVYDPANYGSRTTGALYSVVNAGTCSGPITLAGDAGLVAEAAPLTISGPISGSYGLSVLLFYLNNTVILSSSNTYTGPTSVNAGTLQIGDGTSGEYLASPSISVAPGAALVFNHADSLTYSGSINGYGSLAKLGSGLLALSGSNITYTGGTTISGGTLQLVNCTGFASQATNNSTLVLEQDSGPWFPSPNFTISGSGAVTTTGTGQIYLNANSYTGSTTVSTGLVVPAANSSFGSGSVTVASGAAISLQVSGVNLPNALTISGSGYYDPASWGSLTTGALFSFVNPGTWSGPITLAADAGVVADGAPLTISGPISGSHGLSVLQFYSNNTVILSGSNTYTGPTAINAGTLQIGNGTSGEYLASPSISVASGAALVFDHADALAYSGSISGGGSLTEQGGGTLILSGSNTYTGATSVNASTLQIGGGASGESLASPSITMSNNATVAFNHTDASNSLSYTGAIGGNGQLVKEGAGLLALSGNNNYNGPTTISAGTLQVAGDDNRLPTATALTIASAGVLDLGGNDQTVGRLSGSAGAVVTDNTPGGAYTTALIVNAASGSTTFAGSIMDSTSQATHDSVALVLAGDGELTLSGTNTYDGGTTISGGTLVLADASALPSAGLVTIGGGGWLELGGGSGIDSLFASSAPAMVGGHESKFGNMATLGGAPSLSQGGEGSAVGGSAPAVPEPGTIALLAAAAMVLAAAAWRKRKCFDASETRLTRRALLRPALVPPRA